MLHNSEVEINRTNHYITYEINIIHNIFIFMCKHYTKLIPLSWFFPQPALLYLPADYSCEIWLGHFTWFLVFKFTKVAFSILSLFIPVAWTNDCNFDFCNICFIKIILQSFLTAPFPILFLLAIPITLLRNLMNFSGFLCPKMSHPNISKVVVRYSYLCA